MSDYVRVRVDGRLEYEHRLVAARMLGRALRPGEVVHHIDGDRGNNAPENLRVFSSNGEHLRHEMAGKQKSREHRERIASGVKVARARGGHRRKPEPATHCKRGHEFTEDTTYSYVTKEGARRRMCRTCASRRSRDHKRATRGTNA